MTQWIDQPWVRLARFSMLIMGLLLGGCGDSNSDRSSSATSGNHNPNLRESAATGRPSPGGIWNGVDATGNETLAFITEDGWFRFVADSVNGYQIDGFVGNFCGDDCFDPGREPPPEFGVSPDGNLGFGGFLYPDFSSRDPYPGYGGLCGVEGVLEERSTIRGDFFCEFIHEFEQVEIVFRYNDLYDVDSDLSRIVGHWTDSAKPGRDVISVDALGRVTGQDGGGSNCIYSGTVSVIDPEYNLYDTNLVYSGCTGDAALLNGTEYVGFSAVDETTDPATFTVLAISHASQDRSGTSLVRTYRRM